MLQKTQLKLFERAISFAGPVLIKSEPSKTSAMLVELGLFEEQSHPVILLYR